MDLKDATLEEIGFELSRRAPETKKPFVFALWERNRIGSGSAGSLEQIEEMCAEIVEIAAKNLMVAIRDRN